MLDKGELEMWMRNPVSVLLLAKLRERFKADGWREIHSTEAQPVLQLGRHQGREEVVQYVLNALWADG